MTKALLYYTCLTHDRRIEITVRHHLSRIRGDMELVAVSRNQPIDFGDVNIVVDGRRSPETMHRQIMAGLERVKSDIVFLIESDMLYHPSHFEFVPPTDDRFYYNEHTYKVDYITGQAVFYYTKQVSGCCASRDLLIEHYRKRIARIEAEGKFNLGIGYEPGCHQLPRGIDNLTAERWMSAHPNVDIRHNHNISLTRWRQEDFRKKDTCIGWKLVDEIPGWGVTKGRFDKFIKDVDDGVISMS